MISGRGRAGSQTHIDIVDDWRFGTAEFRDVFKEYAFSAVSIFVEHCMFAACYPEFKNSPTVADGYMIPHTDGFGMIAVEVGTMKDGKWSYVVDCDDMPIRVLRIGFDRSVWLLNERNTDFERKYLKYLRGQFASVPLGQVGTYDQSQDGFAIVRELMVKYGAVAQDSQDEDENE